MCILSFCICSIHNLNFNLGGWARSMMAFGVVGIQFDERCILFG